MNSRQDYNVSVNSIRKTIANNILAMCRLPRFKKVYRNGKAVGLKVSRYNKDVYSLHMRSNGTKTAPITFKVHEKGEPRLRHIVTKAEYIDYFQKPIQQAVASATQQVVENILSNLKKKAQGQNQPK